MVGHSVVSGPFGRTSPLLGRFLQGKFIHLVKIRTSLLGHKREHFAEIMRSIEDAENTPSKSRYFKCGCKIFTYYKKLFNIK